MIPPVGIMRGSAGWLKGGKSVFFGIVVAFMENKVIAVLPLKSKKANGLWIVTVENNPKKTTSGKSYYICCFPLKKKKKSYALFCSQKKQKIPAEIGRLASQVWPAVTSSFSTCSCFLPLFVQLCRQSAPTQATANLRTIDVTLAQFGISHLLTCLSGCSNTEDPQEVTVAVNSWLWPFPWWFY